MTRPDDNLNEGVWVAQNRHLATPSLKSVGRLAERRYLWM
jgi:hypothetical protein